MAADALTTGAPDCAPILKTVLARFEASATSPATPLKLCRADRIWVGDLLETLIAVLDYADGDPDLEASDLDRCLAGEDGPAAAPGFDAQWSAAA